MQLSMFSPTGGGVEGRVKHGLGILTFSLKNIQIPQPRDKIIGQNNTHRGARREVAQMC